VATGWQNFSEPFSTLDGTITSMTAVREQTEVDLDELVHKHQANVWRYLRYLGATTADADDLMQETFLAVNRSNFVQRTDHETAAYLRTVARNQLLMARRREGREVNTVELEAAEQVWVASGDRNVYLAALADCLEKLEGRARTAIHLFYEEKRKEYLDYDYHKPLSKCRQSRTVTLFINPRRPDRAPYHSEQASAGAACRGLGA